MRNNDLTGKKFGLLTVISRNKEKSSPGQIFWNTKCDCGNNFIVCGKHLKQGSTISCGCSKKSIGEQQIETILIEYSINIVSICCSPMLFLEHPQEIVLPCFKCFPQTIKLLPQSHFVFQKI